MSGLEYASKSGTGKSEFTNDRKVLNSKRERIVQAIQGLEGRSDASSGVERKLLEIELAEVDSEIRSITRAIVESR